MGAIVETIAGLAAGQSVIYIYRNHFRQVKNYDITSGLWARHQQLNYYDVTSGLKTPLSAV
jgi:hypothetical protein